MIPYSKELGQSLLPEEQQIIETKYKSKPFCAMSTDELFVSVHALLLKIHVITGWNAPDKEENLNILIDQVAKKLTEDYATVNIDEMELAFRKNPVKDWGKNMNLNLIDEVMTPYLQQRKELSRIEETKAKPLELPAPEISDEDYLEAVKSTYKLTKEWRMLPVLAYDILVREGKINLTKERKLEIKENVQAANTELSEDEVKNLCKSFSVKLFFDGSETV